LFEQLEEKKNDKGEALQLLLLKLPLIGITTNGSNPLGSSLLKQPDEKYTFTLLKKHVKFQIDIILKSDEGL
jgi:hypothetical protein